MKNNIDITKLKTSWTKYDAVKIIEIISNNNLEKYLSGQENFDKPILLSVLGISKINDPLPKYWKDIHNHPKQLRLFSLIAVLFNHHSNIRNFAEKFSKRGMMSGTYIVEQNKTGTNIRSALVVSGASLENYRREKEVPYSFSALFENGQVGLLVKELFKNKLLKIGYSENEIQTENDLVEACNTNDFIQALGLLKNQFEKWIKGDGLNLNEELFQFSQLKIYKEIPLLKVNQWLNDWDDIDFKSPLRNKPKPFFYIFNIDARLLKKLSDVHRRKSSGNRTEDTSIQRNINDRRIEEISKYIEGGFPWSTISKQEQKLPENSMLKMPGLLPTAIIANIIGINQERHGKIIDPRDQLRIENEDTQMPKLVIPDHIFDDIDWAPQLKPIEIIDGQHRLWAFDENQNLSGNYEFPVIAFYDLDRAWQAYLFYTINIKPVKINTSLGFDLYPLLRTQAWLENSKDGLLAYRETRAQEIVEALWLFEESPWYRRINMIGETGGPPMSQAAFIRSIVSTFFKKTGGLYSDILNNKFGDIINWNRAQQAGFVILIWQRITISVKNSKNEWAILLRSEIIQPPLFELTRNEELAFTSKNSFLSRDQGVRAIMAFVNDFFFIVAAYKDIDFNSFIWEGEFDENSISHNNINKAINQFKSNKSFLEIIDNVALAISNVDWRTSSATFNNLNEREFQMRYRGSGGYSELWKEIKKQISKLTNPIINKYSSQLLNL